MSRLPVVFQQLDDDPGSPLIGGKMYFYESGTSTPKTTFADVNLTIPNTNPVILTAAGRIPDVFFNGSARVVLDDANDVQIGEEDPISSTDSTSFGSNWDAITIYAFNEVVSFEVGGVNRLYVSIIGNNENNEPPSTTSAWTEFRLFKLWNANETYNVRDPVLATDFNGYISLSNSNLGNDPVSDGGINWQVAGAPSAGGVFAGWDLSLDYNVGGANIVVASDTNYYVSITTPNLNNNPISSPTFWTRIDFVSTWNTNESYLTDELVRGSDGYIYVAQQNNSAVDPVSDTAGLNWGPRTADLIATNITDIGTNTTNIGTNTTNIGTNTTNIGTNTTDIGNNTTAIGTNTTNIGTNTTDIGNNTTAIGDNDTDILALQTDKANIASPTFTGIPAGPTAAPGTDTDQLATTAHVFAATPDATPSVPGLIKMIALSGTANGSLKIPVNDGADKEFILQWKTVSQAGNTSTSHTLTTPFITSFFGVVGSMTSPIGTPTSDLEISVVPSGLTNVIIYKSGAGTENVTWIAWGI